jgi:hypothetical protein
MLSGEIWRHSGGERGEWGGRWSREVEVEKGEEVESESEEVESESEEDAETERGGCWGEVGWGGAVKQGEERRGRKGWGWGGKERLGWTHVINFLIH